MENYIGYIFLIAGSIIAIIMAILKKEKTALTIAVISIVTGIVIFNVKNNIEIEGLGLKVIANKARDSLKEIEDIKENAQKQNNEIVELKNKIASDISSLEKIIKHQEGTINSIESEAQIVSKITTLEDNRKKLVNLKKIEDKENNIEEANKSQDRINKIYEEIKYLKSKVRNLHLDEPN
jgi:hypothetical protein